MELFWNFQISILDELQFRIYRSINMQISVNIVYFQVILFYVSSKIVLVRYKSQERKQSKDLVAIKPIFIKDWNSIKIDMGWVRLYLIIKKYTIFHSFYFKIKNWWRTSKKLNRRIKRFYLVFKSRFTILKRYNF